MGRKGKHAWSRMPLVLEIRLWILSFNSSPLEISSSQSIFPKKCFYQHIISTFSQVFMILFRSFEWNLEGPFTLVIFFCDFRGDFCYNFKCNFIAISNRPWKLLAIQIAMESPVVYTVGDLKSPRNHTWNCRWNRRGDCSKKSPV